MKSCLILAAGSGSRLDRKTSLKPLTPILGISLIERQILNFYRAGVKEFFVVNGFRGDQLVSELDRSFHLEGISIHHISNPDWEQGNGTSLLAAAPHLKDSFYLTMSDHLFHPQIVQTFIKESLQDDDLLLAIDLPREANRHIDLDDVTKVQLEGERMVKIGKELKTYQAYDTGLFLCHPSLLKIANDAPSHQAFNLSNVVQDAANRQKARCFQIPPLFWADIDTDTDFQNAEQFLEELLLS